jgi:CheY-like chemotaxis protein
MFPKKGAEHRTSRVRVLLVEDEFMVAMLLEDLIAALGCEVVGPIGRVDEALRVAEVELLDVAVLDVNIHGREVYPIADKLAERGIPFVFMTGYGKDGLRQRYSDRPILSKPFHPHEVGAALAQVCGAIDTRPPHG